MSRIPLPMAAAPKANDEPPIRADEPAGIERGDPDQPSPHHWVMVIDQGQCVGCDLCLAACHAYNDTPPSISWSRVEEVEPTADGRRVFRPTPCMHCEDAPCVDICPVGATYHRSDGLVMMDYERCIGCRYCQLSCPYGVRHFNWEAFTGPNPDVPAAGPPVTYYKDVEPIVQSHCLGCHSKGGIAPFQLDTYEAVKGMSASIVAATKAGIMPPWGTTETSACAPRYKWKNDPRLSTTELATLQNLATNGADPLGAVGADWKAK